MNFSFKKLSFKKSEVKNYGQWIQPTLPGTFWCHWHEAKGLEKLTFGKKMHQCIFLNGNSILLKSDVKSISSVAQKLQSPSRAKKYLNILSTLANKYEQEHLAVLNRNDSYNAYIPELFRTYKNVVGLWWFTIPLAEELERLIRKSWPSATDETLFEIAKPIRPTWLELQNRETRKLAEKCRRVLGNKKITLQLLKQKPKLYNSVIKHVQKYQWFGTHHWMGYRYTMPRCISDLNEKVSKQTIKPKKIPRSPLPVSVLTLFRTVNYWRTHCAELTTKVVFESRSVLTSLAKTWHISYEDLTYLSHVEILKNLDQAILPKNLILQIRKRKKEYGCVLDSNGNEQIFTGKAFRETLHKLTSTKISATTSLFGTTASRGPMVIARARIVMSPRDFSVFKKGEILITNETTPDFVPLMKMASAIVTDIGGITSHAAVVSRELGKPCIVGTKHATKVFKNGDILKVDTNDSTVKMTH